MQALNRTPLIFMSSARNTMSAFFTAVVFLDPETVHICMVTLKTPTFGLLFSKLMGEQPNHQSHWQPSSSLGFFLSLRLFIARLIPDTWSRQASRFCFESSGTWVLGGSACRSTGKKPCHCGVPSAAPRGRRSESPGSAGGSSLTDIIHGQPTQMVFIQMQGQSCACWQCSHPCTGAA